MSNESLQKSAELLDAMSKSAQEVMTAFATFKTEQEKGNEVVNSKIDEMDGRINQVDKQVMGEQNRLVRN
jgi:gas vesicle protein